MIQPGKKKLEKKECYFELECVSNLDHLAAPETVIVVQQGLLKIAPAAQRNSTRSHSKPLLC